MSGWRPPTGTGAGLGVALLLLAVGLVIGRPDVALLGLPLAVGAALALRRPTGEGALALRAASRDRTRILAEVTVEAPPAAELAVLALSAWGEPERFAVVAVDGRRTVPVALPVLHSGPQQVLRAQARLVAAGGVLQPESAALSVVIGAVAESVPALPLPPAMSLRPGNHRAPRAGDGSEFRDLAPFVPGDRLRRIDWRATARQSAEGALVVRRTDASAEAAAVVLVDSRVDVGAVVAEWYRDRPARKGVSTLDLARSAALSLASAYLEAGDRVAFHDVGRSGVGVRSGGGRRQRERLIALVDQVAPSSARDLVLPPLPARPVVLLLSAFLDEAPLRLADLVRAQGARVVAVDVLPAPDRGGLDRRRLTAHRLVALERRDRLDRLRATGAAVIPWAAGREEALLEASRARRSR